MTWTHAFVLLWAYSAPPCQESDLNRFPSKDDAAVMMNVSCGRDRWLEANMAWYPEDSTWREQIAEQELLHEAWRDLYWAHQARDGQWQHGATNWLKSLRRVIGEDAYAAGQMPPPLPMWRYQQCGR